MNNISALPKESCGGCGACAEICPVHAIVVLPDDEEFRYPVVDESICIQCGKCVRICPWVTPSEVKNEVLDAYACWNKDPDIRYHSSSAGLFSVLSKEILNRNGVVFGAKFDDELRVIHAYVESWEEFPLLRQSKYVESDLRNTYQETKAFLAAGRYVLFSGTPCQIAGLKRYLGKEEDNLFTVDLICHGVPSPDLFRAYKQRTEAKYRKKIVSIHMREKLKGWGNFGMKVLFSDGSELSELSELSEYLRLFLSDMGLRKSCYQCRFASPNREGDITVGDYWGVQSVHPEIEFEKGVSCALINTEKGRSLWNICHEEFSYVPSNFDSIAKGNPRLIHASEIPKGRYFFYKDMKKLSFSNFCKKWVPIYKKSFWHRCLEKIKYEWFKIFRKRF